MKFFDTPGKRWFVGSVLVAGLVLGGALGGRRYVVPKIKAWRSGHMSTVAREFLAKGDTTNALLTARKILQTQKENVEAWRIAVAATKAKNTPDVIFYQENLARLEPTKANYLEVMRSAVKFEAYGYAIEAIKSVAKNASDDPEFHALAAQSYLRTGRAVAAKFHLIALTQLKPSDRAAQLDLAQLEMAEDPGRKDMALRARVRSLADDPALRVRALSVLLRESIAAKLRVETGELVSRLQATPNLGVPERLLILEGTVLVEGSPSTAVLEQLQKEVAGNPADVVSVATFLIRTNQPQKAIDWFATLPEETRREENVRRVIAEALVSTGNWAALESHLLTLFWPRHEHLRQALLAYGYRAQLRLTDFTTAWKSAVVATGNDRLKIRELMERVDEWKWNTERYDIIWKLFSLDPQNRQVREALIAWERRQGNTANLNRLFARVVEVEPRNEVMRNNLAYTSLLLDSNLARAGLIATELVTLHPEDPYFITTNAFALFKLGNAAEALRRMEALSLAELAEPDRMLHHAVFLSRAGDPGQAAELLRGLDMKRFLPEERKLAENALLDIARTERSQENKTRLVRQQTSGKGGGEGGWLALVSPETRSSASVDMQLSDSLYAASDWNALHVSLRSADWKADDYLRLALLAYVHRQQDDLIQSRDDWKQALVPASRNLPRAQNLQKLVMQWNWTSERLEIQGIIFERTPTDRLLLADLLKQYRDAKRTQDLVRVLTLYVSRSSETTDEAVALAYYSLLTETNVARAHVIAKNAFEAVPDDASRRLTYAYSLLKQRRPAAEAQRLLTDLKPGAASDLVPIPLLRAAILAELGSVNEAVTTLAVFDSSAALPEEAAIAAKLSTQLEKQTENRKQN